jgi:hypothetical protein
VTRDALHGGESGDGNAHDGERGEHDNVRSDVNRVRR